MLIPILLAAFITQAGFELAPEPEAVVFQRPTGARIKAANGVLKVVPGNGWVRSAVMYSDFELRFEYRLEPSSEAIIALRAQRETDGGIRGRAFRLPSSEPAPADGWRTAVVRAEGDRLRLALDTRSGAITDERFAGYVLLQVKRGSVELRNVVMTRLFRSWQRPDRALSLEELKAEGVQPPRLVREVKPSYPRAAMEAGLEGEVHMEALVLVDGTVGEIHVFRSLHPELDREAVETVRKWMFAPASQSGAPVPALVEIQMTFTLK